MKTSTYKAINFLNQTGNFDYDILLNVSNFSGYFEIGLSGSGNNLSFNGQYGKLRDKNQDILIGYTPNQTLGIHGNIYDKKESLSIDGYSIYKNVENTGYNFNYFYLNPIDCELEYSFNLTGETTNFNLGLLNNKIKNFNITGSDGTAFSTKTLTGIILNENPNLEIKIFSGEVLNKTQYYSIGGFPITFYNSGQYLINTNTGEDSLVNDSFEARFYTNFGIVDKTIQISGEIIPLFFLFFNVYPEITGFPNIRNTGYDRIFVNNIKNYYVSYGFVSGAQVQASLTYIAGLTGNVTGFLPATGTFSGLMSGFLTGSGFISTFVSGTGINFSGFNEFLNSTQSSTESGFFAQKFLIATGYSQSNYLVTGFGLGSGIILKDIYASGIQNYTYSGQVPYIGGINVFFTPQPMIGTGKDVDEINQPISPQGLLDYTDVTNTVKIFYTGIITGLALDSGTYSKKILTYEPIRTGKFEFTSFIPGTGLKTGISITGIVTPQFFIDMPFGYFQFIKEITGIISGESRTQDETKIFTGYQDLLSCKTTDNARKYLATALSNSGIITSGYAFLSTCVNGQIPSGFLVKFEKQGEQFFLIQERETVGSLDLNVKNDGCVDYTLELDNKPKWIIIKPTGVFEILLNSGISGSSRPLYSDDVFFNENPDKQYQSFSNSSGSFKDVINDNCSTGLWEQYFQSNIELNENYSNFYIKNTNINLISLEDNGRDYPSEVYFQVKNSLDNYNFQLIQNNTVINKSPQRDLYLKLILSKKILDGYSGFYESDYFKVKTGSISFCTGLSFGDYRARVKYLNFDLSPKSTGKLCRIPVQVANILDKNIYNKINIDLFTGSGQFSQNFYAFRYFGSGWHQQANVYFTKNDIYGHNFITGYTQIYRNMLYTPPFIPTANDFTSDNQIIKALNFTLTGLKWSGSGIKNINIFTNRVSLSGVSKNTFLKYINDIYKSGKFIVNVFDAPDTSLWGKQSEWTFNELLIYSSGATGQNDKKLEVFSNDLNEPFLKDIAEMGGGHYYFTSKATYLNTLYNNYSFNIVPTFRQPMYGLCDGDYPRGSFADGPQPQSDTSAGQVGIDLVNIIPDDSSIIVTPQPPVPTEPATPTPPGPNIPPENEEVDGENAQDENPTEPTARIGFPSPQTSTDSSPTNEKKTSEKGCSNPNKYDIEVTAFKGLSGYSGPVTWVEPWSAKKNKNGTCVCSRLGRARIYVKLTNYNCAPSSRYLSANITIKGRGGAQKRYPLEYPGGRVTVPAAEKNGKPGELLVEMEGDACGPVQGEYMQVLLLGNIIGAQNGDEGCDCVCPNLKPPRGREKEYDTRNCLKELRVPIYRWECQNLQEARDESEQTEIDIQNGRTQRGGSWSHRNAPWWLSGCFKCACKFPDRVSFQFSYPGETKCGFHQCDNAKFLIKLKNQWTGYEKVLGIANLNNSSDGGPRQGLNITLSLASLLPILEIPSEGGFANIGLTLQTKFLVIMESATPGEWLHSSANYYKIELFGGQAGAATGGGNTQGQGSGLRLPGTIIEGCGTDEVEIDLCPSYQGSPIKVF